MRTYDAAFAAALDRPAFSNGTDGEDWMSRWCSRCIHDTGCPLVLVALLGRTPSEWLRQESGYHCVEFRAEGDPGPGYEPPPDPPLPGQGVLVDVAPHVRMFADSVIRPAEVRR